MITEAPLNLECKVVQHNEYKSYELFLGEIVHAYAEEYFLKGNVPDITKIKPFIFSMNDNNYWKLGELLGKAWKIGRKYKK
ncbi:MAG: hypothetical protein ACTSUL_04060 [Promethearchaeota archaeon]